MRETAWPSLRHDLSLSYVEIGVLLTVPGLVASLVEPVLALARNRRRVVLAGGAAYAAALAATALAPTFAVVLVAFVVLSPAAGAFVSLSQASLMDLDPDAHERSMARWTLAGSVGVVAGPLSLAAAFALGVGWRGVFAALAILGVALVWAARGVPHAPAVHSSLRAELGAAARDLRRREVVRWLAVLELADLTHDVFLGFLALYLVDVAGSSPASAGLAVAVWAAATLLGDALLLAVLRRVDGVRYLRWSAGLVALLYPAFLLAPASAKLPLLAALGVANAGSYAVPQARLYSQFPGRSGAAVAVSNAGGLVGQALPVALGALAASFGLGAALWTLLLGPLGVLALLGSRRDRPRADGH